MIAASTAALMVIKLKTIRDCSICFLSSDGEKVVTFSTLNPILLVISSGSVFGSGIAES